MTTSNVLRYEIAKLDAPHYTDAPYFIVRSQLIKRKRQHVVVAGRYPTQDAAEARIKQLENSATT